MMLAYAANRPVVGRRQSSPNALLLVISAHVALVAVVMSARMDLPRRIFEPPIPVTLYPVPHDPPPRRQPPVAHPLPNPAPQPPIPIPHADDGSTNTMTGPMDTGPIVARGEDTA